MVPASSIWLQERDERLCRLLACVLSEDGELTPELEQGLRRAGVDLRRLRRCLAAYCRPKREPVEDKPASSEERATAAELSSLLAAWQRPRDETEGGCRG